MGGRHDAGMSPISITLHLCSSATHVRILTAVYKVLDKEFDVRMVSEICHLNVPQEQKSLTYC